MDILLIIVIAIVAIIIIGSFGAIINTLATLFGWLFKSAFSFIMGMILIFFIIGSCIGGCPNIKNQTTTTTK